MAELCNKVKSGEEWRVKSRAGFFSRKPTPPATRKLLPNRSNSPIEIYLPTYYFMPGNGTILPQLGATLCHYQAKSGISLLSNLNKAHSLMLHTLQTEWKNWTTSYSFSRARTISFLCHHDVLANQASLKRLLSKPSDHTYGSICKPCSAKRILRQSFWRNCSINSNWKRWSTIFVTSASFLLSTWTRWQTSYRFHFNHQPTMEQLQ